jgi:hypothetical protein
MRALKKAEDPRGEFPSEKKLKFFVEYLGRFDTFPHLSQDASAFYENDFGRI